MYLFTIYPCLCSLDLSQSYFYHPFCSYFLDRLGLISILELLSIEKTVEGFSQIVVNRDWRHFTDLKYPFHYHLAQGLILELVARVGLLMMVADHVQIVDFGCFRYWKPVGFVG